ncbi:MAG: hypothetical protein JW800_07075 [Candidatus Omnitrophica bacterium]|nr:hypothetical protein [Candidatus Omnitrophota bacterium]
MRKAVVFILVLSFICAVTPSYAAKGRKGASDSAIEHASDEAIFHRVGDWFATVGKSDEEKKVIIAERKAKRAATRAQKTAEKQKRKMEQETQKTGEKIKEKFKNMGGKIKSQ